MSKDKLGHFAGCLILAGGFGLLFSFFAGFCISMSIGILKEVLDWLSMRVKWVREFRERIGLPAKGAFEWGDILADFLGAFLGAALVAAL